MSLLGKVGNFLKKTVKTVAPLAVGYATGGVGGALLAAAGGERNARTVRPSPTYPQQMAGFGPIIPANPFPTRVIPGAGRSVTTAPRRITPLAPIAVQPASGQQVERARRGSYYPSGRKKYRRMNPCNGKAAKRAVRRIKSTMHLLRDIEKLLPKQRHHAPSRAPRSRKC